LVIINDFGIQLKQFGIKTTALLMFAKALRFNFFSKPVSLNNKYISCDLLI
jgi:hypothetical protein